MRKTPKQLNGLKLLLQRNAVQSITDPGNSLMVENIM